MKDYLSTKYHHASSKTKNFIESGFSHAVLDLLSENNIEFEKERLEKIAKEASTTQIKTETQKMIMEILEGEHEKFLEYLKPYLVPFLNNK